MLSELDSNASPGLSIKSKGKSLGRASIVSSSLTPCRASEFHSRPGTGARSQHEGHGNGRLTPDANRPAEASSYDRPIASGYCSLYQNGVTIREERLMPVQDNGSVRHGEA